MDRNQLRHQLWSYFK
uniref:Uncharacterized protein n=1 Tax=Arundo donax TaxID=35708 RepID=A0A0A8YQN1_ARUDO